MLRKTPSVEATRLFLDTVTLDDIERPESVYQKSPQGGYVNSIPGGYEESDDNDSNDEPS